MQALRGARKADVLVGTAGYCSVSASFLSCLAGNDFADVERRASDSCGKSAAKQSAMNRRNCKS